MVFYISAAVDAQFFYRMSVHDATICWLIILCNIFAFREVILSCMLSPQACRHAQSRRAQACGVCTRSHGLHFGVVHRDVSHGLRVMRGPLSQFTIGFAWSDGSRAITGEIRLPGGIPTLIRLDPVWFSCVWWWSNGQEVSRGSNTSMRFWSPFQCNLNLWIPVEVLYDRETSNGPRIYKKRDRELERMW